MLYKQSLSNSCLVAALLITQKAKYGRDFNKKDEERITLRGMDRKYSFYVVGVAGEFSRYYSRKLKIFVDNKYFTNVLRKDIADDKIAVVHQKITLDLLIKQLEKGPLICHIDDHFLGDYSHASHFVVVEKMTAAKVTIIDPWYGKRMTISQKTLKDAIASLKNHIKMCPLVFSVEANL